jgi:hypothetical protein
MRHYAGANQEQHAQQSLHKPLPGLDYFAFAGLGIKHGPHARHAGDARVAGLILNY